jgi:hypothetical protein
MAAGRDDGCLAFWEAGILGSWHHTVAGSGRSASLCPDGDWAGLNVRKVESRRFRPVRVRQHRLQTQTSVG